MDDIYTRQATIVTEIPDTPQPEMTGESPVMAQGAWRAWGSAFLKILPIYTATHIAFLLLTYLALLFRLGNFSPARLQRRDLLYSWFRWDSGHFTFIAEHGYDQPWRTAFFPLYSLLEAGLRLITQNAFLSGLIISNIASLLLFTTFYRLVEQDFDGERAYRAVLYLALFPTAFFLAAAYNEALFLCLALLSFYHARRGQWWLAGLCGFLAALTRSAGIFLLLPFCYECLRQRQWRLQKVRFSALGALLIPAGLAVFAYYCYMKFHDPLSFSHAQSVWQRQLSFPWTGFLWSWRIARTHSFFSFDGIHALIDAGLGLFMGFVLLFGWFGPWRFSRAQWSYNLYALACYLFLLLFPATLDPQGMAPLQSLSRLVIELFPAFIILAGMGRQRSVHLHYLIISTTWLAFMLLQFLSGRWIV